MEMQKYAAEQRKEERKRNRLAVRQLDCQTDDKLEINLTITSKWTRRQSTCEFFVQIETRLCVIRAQGRMKECKTDREGGRQTKGNANKSVTGNGQLANTQCAQHAIKYAAKHQSKAKSSRATRNCKRCALVNVPCVWHCMCVWQHVVECVCVAVCGQCASSFAAR